MKKTSTLTACGILSVAMAASVLSGCGDKKIDGTQTAMVIDGEELSFGLVNYFVRTQQASTYAQMSGMMAAFGGDGKTFWTLEEDGVTYGEEFKESMLTDLANKVEIRKHAEELGVSISDEERQKLEETASAFYEKNEEVMKKLGVSLENVQEALELKTLELKIRPEVVKDTDRNVSDDEAAQTTCTYVRLKKSDDDAENKETEKQMQEILKKVQDADAGADLAEIAKTVNEEAYSAQYGYNQGAYDDDNNVLDAAIKEILPDLKDGQVYDQVIEGDKFYFVIRMDHLFDREKTDAKKETIIAERENTLYTETVEGWTADITPETKECWDKLVIDDSEVFTLPQN